jgi:hypothetical protein
VRAAIPATPRSPPQCLLCGSDAVPGRARLRLPLAILETPRSPSKDRLRRWAPGPVRFSSPVSAEIFGASQTLLRRSAAVPAEIRAMPRWPSQRLFRPSAGARVESRATSRSPWHILTAQSARESPAGTWLLPEGGLARWGVAPRRFRPEILVRGRFQVEFPVEQSEVSVARRESRVVEVEIVVARCGRAKVLVFPPITGIGVGHWRARWTRGPSVYPAGRETGLRSG